MIGTTILFGCIITLGMLFLILGVLRIAEEYYMDIILIFLSSTIFTLSGYQCLITEALLEFEFLGLFLVLLGVISALYGVVRIFDVAIEDFGWYSNEFDRDANR